MAHSRRVCLALLLTGVLASTGCASTAVTTTPTPAQPTPAPSSFLAKGDLPAVAQQPTTTASATTAPATTATPVATALLITPGAVAEPIVTSTASPGLTFVAPSNLPTVINPGRLRATPGTAFTAPSPGAPCTPGTSARPTITSVYPSAGAAAGGADVMISGTNLGTSGQTTFVSFGDVIVPAYGASATNLFVIAPPGKAGAVTVRVWTAQGCGEAAARFTYQGPATVSSAPSTANTSGPCLGGAAPAPSIRGMLPRQLSTLGGELVTIAGSNLGSTTGPTVVLFGNTPATAQSINNLNLTVVAPPGPPGALTVKVATPQGCASYSAADLKYVLPKPTVTSVSPPRGPKAGGTSIVITGTNLGSATVKIGSKNATIVSNTATAITVITPGATSAGQATLAITTAGGGTGLLFTYTP